MATDDKIKDGKLQYGVIKNCNKQQKYTHYHLKKLINMNILHAKKYHQVIKVE